MASTMAELSARMDMDMGSGGMDMGASMFQVTNIELARDFWYIIAGVVGLLAFIRIVNYSQTLIRLRRCRVESTKSPTRVSGFYQIWATLTAVAREMSYPQFYVPIRFFKWATPPPLGKIIVLLCYWAVIVYIMSSGVVVYDAFFWERIGFRNAWVTIMQLPLLFLLSAKVNIVALVIGSSHERLNWLHRWVARTMFVTATVHGFHFYTEYVRGELWNEVLQVMPLIKYGIGAWAVLLWTCVTSFCPIRSMAYEVFVAQHVLSYVLFLWLIYVHIPSYAMYNLWFAIAVLCLDRLARTLITGWQNVRVRLHRTGCNGQRRFGHDAQIRAIGENVTIITIKDVHFKWQAGQHLYLWLPRVGLLEAHPYTIACAHQLPETCICNSIQLVLRTHKGFSKRIHDFATRDQGRNANSTYAAFVTGPYGKPPRWSIYETLILISASTGASFTLPILENILQQKTKVCTKRIEFVLSTRNGEDIGFYVQRLRAALERAKTLDIVLTVHIAITGTNPRNNSLKSSGSGLENSSTEALEKSGPQMSPSPAAASAACCCGPSEDPAPVVVDAKQDVTSDSLSLRIQPSGRSTRTDGLIREYSNRPDIERHIREPVEQADGETSVVVCGGPSLVTRVRNCVAKLSDERAVHKGTGAQGIHLHVEEYSF